MYVSAEKQTNRLLIEINKNIKMTPYKSENNTDIVRRIISTNIQVLENRINQYL